MVDRINKKINICRDTKTKLIQNKTVCKEFKSIHKYIINYEMNKKVDKKNNNKKK